MAVVTLLQGLAGSSIVSTLDTDDACWWLPRVPRRLPTRQEVTEDGPPPAAELVPVAARCEPGSSSTAGEEEARGARPVEPFTAPRALASEG
jgi:hypothetical protein